MFKHILFATDGSPASEHAAAIAAKLAATHGARLTALYVVDPYPYLGVGESNPVGFEAYMATGMQHAAQAHARVAQLCSREGVALEKRVAQDTTAASGIVETARDTEADLVVVGSHGRTGIARLVVGSVAARVVDECPVPVLVVR
jgi:nucleotide-binding universal stress UspA family protein